MPRPIILIGLPGAGKTTVAPAAAQLLATTWCDVDQEISRQAGLSIAEIFATHGEAHFRTLERQAIERALGAGHGVIAAGAGWAAQPGNMAGVGPRALTIYLSLAPTIAASRLARTTDRPLLGAAPAATRLLELAAEREHWYRLADIEIAVDDAPPDAVAEGVATAARQYGGW